MNDFIHEFFNEPISTFSLLKMGDQVYKKWSPVIRDLKIGLLGLSYFVKFKLCVCDKDRCVRKLQGHVNEAFFLNKEEEDCRLERNLHVLLASATAVIGYMGSNMYTDHHQLQGDMFGFGFCITRSSCVGIEEGGSRSALHHVRNWIRTHEEAQVMLASILVVVGLWWLVRAVLTLLINLVCPLLVVILAVVCVPQLRAPLLGQNYPLLANVLRNILLKMADNIRSS